MVQMIQMEGSEFHGITLGRMRGSVNPKGRERRFCTSKSGFAPPIFGECRLAAAETFGVGSGRLSKRPFKGGKIFKTAFQGDLRHRPVRGAEEKLGVLDALEGQKVFEGDPEVFLEGRAQVGNGEFEAGGETGQGERFSKMFGHKTLNGLKARRDFSVCSVLFFAAQVNPHNDFK